MRCRGFLIMFNPLHNFNYLIFSPPQSPACMEAFWEHASSGQSNLYRKYHFCFRAACFKKNPITGWQRTCSCLIPLLNTGCINFFLLLTVKTAQSLLRFSGIISRSLIKIYLELHKVNIHRLFMLTQITPLLFLHHRFNQRHRKQPVHLPRGVINPVRQKLRNIHAVSI